jgi:hypothetical protein
LVEPVRETPVSEKLAYLGAVGTLFFPIELRHSVTHRD